MSRTVSTSSKVRSFATGALVGVTAYALYIHFIEDAQIASLVGLVFFPFQYDFFLDLPLSFDDPAVGVGMFTALFAAAALLYGYVFLCFRWSPGLAVGTFLAGGGFCYASLTWDLPHAGLVDLLTWPKSPLAEMFSLIDPPVWHPVQLFTCCSTVGLWYAGLVCGVRTLLRPLPRKRSIAEPEQPPRSAGDPTVSVAKQAPENNQQVIIRCSKCNRQLRLTKSRSVLQIRCPACRFSFEFAPEI